MRVAGEDEVVVGEVVVALVEAEIEDDAGAGGLVRALVLKMSGCRGAGEEFAMGADGVFVGYNGVEAIGFARGGGEASYLSMGAGRGVDACDGRSKDGR